MRKFRLMLVHITVIYGESKDVDVYNWIKKLEIVINKAPESI
ncbi:MAG: hypothetical protein U5R49_24755 [Deltaproteobacteria bacterium]|nr:hypothetical protein [Deltaproteobacteria bacterium]